MKEQPYTVPPTIARYLRATIELHHSAGNETGWNAWCLEVCSFTTLAPTGDSVRARVPAKFAEHHRCLQFHGLPQAAEASHVDVVATVYGNEGVFAWDPHPDTPELIDENIALLNATRLDLNAPLNDPPDMRNSPYRAFGP